MMSPSPQMVPQLASLLMILASGQRPTLIEAVPIAFNKPLINLKVGAEGGE